VPAWGVLLELPFGLICTVDTTTFGTFLKGVGDVVRDL